MSSILDGCCRASIQLPPNILISYRNLYHLETTKLHYPETANSFENAKICTSHLLEKNNLAIYNF